MKLGRIFIKNVKIFGTEQYNGSMEVESFRFHGPMYLEMTLFHQPLIQNSSLVLVSKSSW